MSTEEAYNKVLVELSKLYQIIELHKQVMNIAILALNKEVISLEDWRKNDDMHRAYRQKELDDVLQRIILWQWVGRGVETGAILGAIVIWLLNK